MKLMLAVLLCTALGSCLLAQEKTNALSSDGQGNSIYAEEKGESVAERTVIASRKAPYRLIAELGYGAMEEQDYFYKAALVNGLQVNPHLYLGIGIGLQIVMQEAEGWSGALPAGFVPFYADARLFLSKGNLSPFLALDAGKSFDMSLGRLVPGWMINPMAGLSMERNTRLPFHLGLGYHFQKIGGDAFYPGKDFNTFNGFTFSVGVTI